jgi:uncharacterized membrane protein
MKRLALRFLLVLVLLAAGVAVYGATLPVKHRAASTARFRQPRDALWEVVSDLEGQAAWREGVERVERLPDRDGRPAWLVHAGRHGMPLVVTEWDPPHRMRTETPPDADLPFAGSWTWQVSEADGGASVTLVEEGEIPNPLLRGTIALFLGYHGTMDDVLEQLGRRFGEEVVPTHIPQAPP